jgi:hypothetical protein
MFNKLSYKERYEAFLNEQNIILQELNKKKEELENLTSKLLLQPQSAQKRKYDDLMVSVERLREEIGRVLIINEIIPKIIAIAEESINTVKYVNNMLDNFAINIGNAQISTLENLSRETINKNYSKEDIDSLSEEFKMVLHEKYGETAEVERLRAII